ncbi:MAG: histidine--tRNA ligase [Bacilli bacterium]|nr:histidine--tRNA ligase [Bacilli bacterium]MDD4808424.1 histidine--tRNA ligase [Bacilli bacterium]
MIQKPKGTYDIYGGEKAKKLLYIENLLVTLMQKYNYEYFRTPIFEASELFHRGVGETTDIVSKETYDFKDRGDRMMTLRPEGTAGVVRSYIENKLYGGVMPLKTWYYGPMYRYERPQSGRFREFYQFGIEVFGTNDPMTDAEIISIAVNFYKLLGLKGIKVNINSLGDNESRETYRQALVEYLEPYIDELCEDCKDRYTKNPLRILDCKVDKDTDILKNIPKTIDYLNEDSKAHFEAVQAYLKELQIEFVINPSIVRGLDYYTHTVFEVEANVEGFGSQNVLCGGGRYNNLVETMDGPSTPGVGFAMGLERLLTALEFEKIELDYDKGIDLYVIPMSESEKLKAITVTQFLRLNGFSAEIDYMSRNLKNNFKQADRLNSKFVVIIGNEEVETGILTIKNNETKEEYKVKLDEIIDFMDKMLGE